MWRKKMFTIQCPQCKTKFNITGKEDILNHDVKCYKCQTTWIAQSINSESIFNETKNDDLPPAPMPEPEISIKKPKRNFLPFLFGLGIAILIGWIFMLKNTPIENGLKADLSLILSPLEYKTENEPELIIRGHITNKTDELYRLPQLNIILFDKNHSVLQKKTRLPPIRLLGPQRVVEIEFKLKNPPLGVHKVEVNFETKKQQ